MGNFFQTCRVCSAPKEIVDAVNAALAKKERLADIAARTGFSRSGLSRHDRRCRPREVVREFKNRLGTTGRIVVDWGTHLQAHNSAKILHQDDLKPDDVIFQVCYAAPLSQQEQAQSHHIDVSEKILDEAYEENAERFPAN